MDRRSELSENKNDEYFSPLYICEKNSQSLLDDRLGGKTYLDIIGQGILMSFGAMLKY